MPESIVTLKKGEGREFGQGGPWIYDNEIDTIVGTFKNGDIVAVHAFNGYMLGRGYINQNSKIRIRMMTRNADQLIDDEFIYNRVKAAWIIARTQWTHHPAASSSVRRISCRELSWISMRMYSWFRLSHLA